MRREKGNGAGMREQVFVMRRVTAGRTHRRFEVEAGLGIARRIAGHRKPAVAAVGSNHPAQEEDLAQNSFRKRTSRLALTGD